jgi:hypothetical protein
MQNSEFRIQNTSRHGYRAIDRPTSRVPRSCARPRRGVSIVEVIFAIGITSVGLLGAIAIFPVASAQVRKARTNDAMAAAGRSAVHLFDTWGMRRPTDRWYTWYPNVSPPQFGIVAWQQGVSYCIDSRFVVRNKANWNTAQLGAQVFPYNSPLNPPGVAPTLNPRMSRVAFFPGTLDPANVFTRDQFDRQNITQADALGAPAYGRNLLLADSLFVFSDDLAILRPGIDDVSKLNLPGVRNDRSQPSFQIFPTLSGGIAGPRPTQGHMSWMATLVPKIDLYSGQGSDEYVLSIVVFNDRPNDLFLTTYANGGNENILERVVNVVVQGDGSSGGEVLLSYAASQSTTNDKFAAERLKLRANDWILLAGKQVAVPNAVDRFQWYRVTHCDTEIDYGNNVSGAYSRYATLIGQDWNTNLLLQQATLMEGAAAVYEKTIRLDYGSAF